jgi:hypothetical protein
MRRLVLLLVVAIVGLFGPAGWAFAAGPSGSTECALADDDCDGSIDEDGVDGSDNDGDGAVDEDPAGDAADDPGENQVDCNESTSEDVGGAFFLYAGANGVEACADDSSQVPVDGRIILTNDQGGYASADGDASNDPSAQGYARIDGDGVHCGDLTNEDSTAADQSGNTQDDCDPTAA